MVLVRAGVRGEQETRGDSPPARPSISRNSVAGIKIILLEYKNVGTKKGIEMVLA